MFIKTANYIGSYTKTSQCPPPIMPEYAFIGRSNVGKSSLINMLMNHKGLARVSNRPGKTQAINYYLVNDGWYVVDLPGYGYAKTSQSNRADWEKMIHNFLAERETIQCVFLLVDSRLEPQKNDIAFANTLGEIGVPFIIIFTKADKLSLVAVDKNVALFKKEMLKHWSEMPQYFISSAEEKKGRDEILSFIGKINNDFRLEDLEEEG